MEISKLTISPDTPNRTVTRSILKWLLEHPQMCRSTNAPTLAKLMLPTIKEEFPAETEYKVAAIIRRSFKRGLLQRAGGKHRYTIWVDYTCPNFPESLAYLLDEDEQARREGVIKARMTPTLPAQPAQPCQTAQPSVEYREVDVEQSPTASPQPTATTQIQLPQGINLTLSISIAINGVPITNEPARHPTEQAGISEGVLPSAQDRPRVSEPTQGAVAEGIPSEAVDGTSGSVE